MQTRCWIGRTPGHQPLLLEDDRPPRTLDFELIRNRLAEESCASAFEVLSSPLRMLSSVDLPHPTAPRMQTNSRGRVLKVASWTARIRARPLRGKDFGDVGQLEAR